MALAVAGAMLVVGCGGGGGGGSEASAPAPVTSSMTVTPSLGKFNTSCSVEALKADGSVLDSVKVGADGKAVLSATGINFENHKDAYYQQCQMK